MTKKVLFYHDEFPNGGAERVTIDVANYVSSYNYEIFVVACKVNFCSNTKITVLQLPRQQSLMEAENMSFIVDVIHSLSIDIFILPIHLNISLLKLVKEKTDCKLIFSLHCVPYWEVVSHLYIKKRKAEGNILKTLEWWLITYPKTMWLKKYHKRIGECHRQIYNLVDAYTVLCDEYRDILQKKLALPIDSNKLHVIYNSETPVLEISQQKRRQLLYVGRISYDDKRVDRLMYIWGKICKRVPEWELIVVGDGEYKQNVELLATELKLERIRFVGYQSDVRSFYKNASILCLTSNFEGWPLALTEAQANGVIPFAFNCTAGVQKILAPSGVNGILIPPYRLDKYAKELLSLMSNPQRMDEMRQNVILKAKEYSPDRIGEKWLNLFELLCN